MEKLQEVNQMGPCFFIEAANAHIIKCLRALKSDIEEPFSSFKIADYRDQSLKNDAKARLSNVKKKNLKMELITWLTNH